MTSTYTSNPPVERGRVQGVARAGPNPAPRRGGTARYLVWGLGNSQWNAFLAFPRYVHAKLSRARRHAARGLRVRRRRLAGVGAPARRLEQRRVARAARAVRRAADRSGGGARCGGEGRRRCVDRRRLEHGDGDVARQARTAAPRVLLVAEILTNAVGADTIEVRVLWSPGAPGGGVAEAHTASGDRPARRRRVHGRRPPRRLPEERRGAASSGWRNASVPRWTACSWCRRH